MAEVVDVVVVGAGAAGLVAAGRAAELGASVVLLDKMERPGRKLLLTGKGRCNITNSAGIEEFSQHIHPDACFLQPAFAQFFSQDIIRILNDHGCATVLERGGRFFPASNASADVVRALLQRATQFGVELRLGHKVEQILLDANGQAAGVRVRPSKRPAHDLLARRVICCTGGLSYPATGSDGDGFRFAAALGHPIEPLRQALVPMETAGDLPSRMDGLSLRNVEASVWVNGQLGLKAFGELLFTTFGVSGPIILTLSRFMVDALRRGDAVDLCLDLKPALSEAKLGLRLLRDLEQFGHERMASVMRKSLPAPMVPVMLALARIAPAKPGNQLTPDDRHRLVQHLKNFRLSVLRPRSFREAIITAGGVATNDVDPHTMESRRVKNLYFAGEVLDLDADTGGYNLQIAFSTGWLAGSAASNMA